jgi:DNA-binding PadR family transcriptional regulator
VLAVLDQGACYGNQLRAEFERRTGGVWPLNVGQVYSTLERLVRDGLVTRQPSNETGKVRYWITDEGRTEARAWLSNPVERTTVARDEFIVKLALAMSLPGADPAGLIEAQRRAVSSTRVPALPVDYSAADRVIRESTRLAARAELDWLDYCETLLPGRETYGLAAEPPRRGRPARAS